MTLIVAGTLAALLAFLLPTRQLMTERRNRAEAEHLASEAVASYKLKVHDMLIPLFLTVGDVVAAPNTPARREAQQKLQQMVVDLAAEYIGPDRSRACFFALEGTTPSGRCLRLKNWRGRNKKPRQNFAEDTPCGEFAIKVVMSLDAQLIPDVDTAGLPDVTSDGSVKTFICATVFANDRPLGMLSLDSLQPGDLKEDDLDLIRLFAQLLATGLAAG